MQLLYVVNYPNYWCVQEQHDCGSLQLHSHGRVLRIVCIPFLALMRSRLTAMLSISTVITIEQFGVLIRLQILEQSAIVDRLFTSSFASVKAMPNER